MWSKWNISTGKAVFGFACTAQVTPAFTHQLTPVGSPKVALQGCHALCSVTTLHLTAAIVPGARADANRAFLNQHLHHSPAALVVLACGLVRTVNSRPVAPTGASSVRPHSHSQDGSQLTTKIESISFYCQRFVPFVSQVRTCQRWPSKQNI